MKKRINLKIGMRKAMKNDQSKYWFTKDKIDRIKNVHLYLEKLRLCR